jgi:hypothetical protein
VISAFSSDIAFRGAGAAHEQSGRERGVCSLDLACFRQHLLDLAVRDHYGA